MTQRKFLTHVTRSRGLILLLLGAAAMLLYATVSAYATPPKPVLMSLTNSVPAWVGSARTVGQHSVNDQMAVGVVLQTSNPKGQQALLNALYNPKSSQYQHWLQTGEFDARFAPSKDAIDATKQYLTNMGLSVSNSASPTLLLATGKTSQVEAAFHTQINDYRTVDGQQYFANASAVKLPSTLMNTIVGVTGLSNRALHVSHAMREPLVQTDGQAAQPKLPPPYGGGPNGTGLTPSQIAGIYDINPVYQKLKNTGKGITLGLYELSGYTHSDINFYKKTFHLPNVPVVDKNVLGGPIAINGSVDYGAGEVELDIELQLATAPGAKQIQVYNAPNSELGTISEYLQMAKDNTADVISSSWGLCEYFTDSTIRTEELQAFTQMAMQGQTLFAAAGDNGAYDCGTTAQSGLKGNDALQADDPAANPFVTGVGGTSFRQPNGGAVAFDPGQNQNPSYPGTSSEYEWNRGCTPDKCDGAGGGGVSRFWASSDYVASNGTVLPGVQENNFSQTGAYCQQTAASTCRQVPDISINADPATGYAIYCTNQGGQCNDPNFSVKGWSRYGGTSCGAPIWSGIAALYDVQHKGRVGLFNYRVYQFDSTDGYAHQFHDITQGDNGHYPAGANYDMSTGIGTPDAYQLVNK